MLGVAGCWAPTKQPCANEPCEGDWPSRCGTACAPGDCCVPRGGRFTCAARIEGACPQPNLVIDRARAERSVSLEWASFAATDCAVVEGCVPAPGRRRLLRFAVAVKNEGAADVVLGPPEPPVFERASCFGFWQRREFAVFRLSGDGGVVEATKAGACLSDDEPREGATYTCSNQGLSAGFSDVYGVSVECQWLDVTGLPPGRYRLELVLNASRQLDERDFTDNLTAFDVTLTP